MAEEKHSQAVDVQLQKLGADTIGGVTENSRMYIHRLIIVAITANELIESAQKCDRYYFRVNTQRFNALKQSLQALGKTKEVASKI